MTDFLVLSLCRIQWLEVNFSACFEVQSPPSLPPLHLFLVGPDVTRAESLTERTFHGNEVRVMVCPGAKRSAWNTKRRTPWKPRADSTERSRALAHLKMFIKTVCEGVCEREKERETCNVSFWVKPHLSLSYTLRYEVHFYWGIEACSQVRP